jgi:hypothetical protein
MKLDIVRTRPLASRTRVLLSLAIGACVTLLASECSRSHVQETVTVAPRASATPARATSDLNSSSASPAVDAEAAGDAIAHAIVALKARRRDEALSYMNLARTQLTRLTHQLNRPAAAANANSNPTLDRLIGDLRELDAAERAARHNDYQQSVAQLHTISDELDHLNSSLIHPLN